MNSMINQGTGNWYVQHVNKQDKGVLILDKLCGAMDDADFVKLLPEEHLGEMSDTEFGALVQRLEAKTQQKYVTHTP